MNIILGTLFIALLIILGYAIYKSYQQDINSEAPPKIAIIGTGIAGTILFFCSIGLSTTFGISMGENHPFISIPFAFILLSLSIAQYLSPSWLLYFIHKGEAIPAIGAVIILFLGFFASIVAGQALIASAVDYQKKQRLENAHEYQSHIERKESLNDEILSLAVSNQQFNQAKETLAKLKEQAQQEMKTNVEEGWSDCSEFPGQLCRKLGYYQTKTRELNSTLGPIRNEMLQQEDIINRYNRYQAMQELLGNINKENITPSTAVDLPHIIWLSEISGYKPETIEARLYVGLAFFAEFTGIVMLMFYSHFKQSAKKKAVIQ